MTRIEAGRIAKWLTKQLRRKKWIRGGDRVELPTTQQLDALESAGANVRVGATEEWVREKSAELERCPYSYVFRDGGKLKEHCGWEKESQAFRLIVPAGTDRRGRESVHPRYATGEQGARSTGSVSTEHRSRRNSP